MIEGLNPERSVEDILAGRLRLTFGEKTFDLPVLSIAANRRWREGMEARLQPLVNATGSNSVTRILKALTAADDALLDLVLSYDETHVLPDKAELEELARPADALRALLEVRAAANPLLGVSRALRARPAPEPSPDSTSSPSTSGRASQTRGRSKPD